MFLSSSELHLKALSKSENSSKINPPMTVVRLGFVTQMLVEMQDNFRKIIEEKDSEIESLILQNLGK